MLLALTAEFDEGDAVVLLSVVLEGPATKAMPVSMSKTDCKRSTALNPAGVK